ncbi:MAG: response regulator [Catonella sp.]|nr:response regulator [Catonella sp.]MDY6356418.1 response regulator [Catonella sp.]
MKNILIAEDEKLIRAGIRAMTERSGVQYKEIFEAKNGEEALEIIKNNPIDLLLTDIRMPKMDGIELVRNVHEMEPRPVIIAISGYDDFSYAVEMLRNGVSEYLLKPLERKKFKETLERADSLVSEKNKDLKTLEKEFEAAKKEKLDDFFFPEGKPASVSDKLKQNAEKYLTEASRTKRLQLIGTDKTDKLTEEWHSFFEAGRRGYIESETFLKEIIDEAHELGEIYKTRLSDTDLDILAKFNEPDILAMSSLDELEETFMNLIIGMNRANEEINADPAKNKIAEAVKYVNENYDKDINMAVVSNYISMNYSLFSFSFKEYTGVNFVSYLKDLRLKKAKELLETTDEKVIDVGAAVGYDNSKHFMKLFKSEYGISPTEYRKNMRKE